MMSLGFLLEGLDVARDSTRGKQPPPSWLPDPTERHVHRWWDGGRWAAHVADGDTVTEDPVDLGQGGADWRALWETPEIAQRRVEVLMARHGVSRAELAGLESSQSLGNPTEVPRLVQLLRTPRDQVTGYLNRTTQASLLNGRNAYLLEHGEAVALVHCRRCGAVVELAYEGMGG
ncbi:MAG TPA: DUF2510 domain-containing protein, partial [Acidimicrobiales bacterium]|nr:DUF2510 domain-containing protein [Acidimicrobiales bacterium]